MAKEVYSILKNHLAQAMEGHDVFFVGAGVSFPSGLPTFLGINEKLIAALSHGEASGDDAKYLSETLRPEVVYQVGLDELGPDVLLSMEVLEGADPTTYHFLLAEAIRRGSSVFTTNVDDLIEKACSQIGLVQGQHFDICRGRSDDQDFKDYLQKIESGTELLPGLFKLHGSIDSADPPSKYSTIQFALRQVGRGLFDSRRRVLEYFLKDYSFWFMGYSCRDDFSVLPVFSNTPSEKDSYWFKYDDGPLSVSLIETDRSGWDLAQEGMKSLDADRDQETINVGQVLSMRGCAYKFVGNPMGLLEELYSDIGVAIPSPGMPTPKEMTSLDVWAQNLPAWKRRFFISRLFEEAGRWERAVEFCEKAGHDPSIEQPVLWERLADIYYKKTDRDASEQAIQLYQQCVDSLPSGIRRAKIKSRISNVLRRLGPSRRDEAHEIGISAVNEYEAATTQSERETDLEYARCLNIYALSLSGRQQFDESRDLFEESKGIKKLLGDVDGIAESDNALSIAYIQEGRSLASSGNTNDAKYKFCDAITHALDAVDARRRIGNLRGYAQNLRNLAWAYAELMKLSDVDEIRNKYFSEARDGYVAGITAWRRMIPPPNTEVILFTNLLARLYIDYCLGMASSGQNAKWSAEGLELYKILFDGPEIIKIAHSDQRNPTTHDNLANLRKLFEESGMQSQVQEIEIMLAQLEEP